MRTLLLALATPFIQAIQASVPEMILAMNNQVPSQVEDKFLDNQELIISTGTYPCIFKVGDNFYDYTPFKLAASDAGIVPEAIYYTD